MHILCAVLSCERDIRNGYNQTIRDTWGPSVTPFADLYFFVGRRSEMKLLPDEIRLPCKDDYKSMLYKTVEILRWAIEKEYDYILKVTTDIYLRANLVFQSGFEKFDYMGAPVGHIGQLYGDTNVYAFIQGDSFWLSNKAARIVVNEAISLAEEKQSKVTGLQVNPSFSSDDMWISQTLTPYIMSEQILVYEDSGYVTGPITIRFPFEHRKELQSINWVPIISVEQWMKDRYKEDINETST